jgi:hypothetical protein
MRHPDVGDLYLTRSKLDLAHSGGQHILTFPRTAQQRIGARTRPATRIASQRTRCVTAQKHVHQANHQADAG